MRLKACLGIFLLGAGGCNTLPGHILLDVDGSIVEIKKKAPPPAPEPDSPAEANAAGDEPTR